VFAPLTAVLESAGSWRSAYAILAAPLAVTIALHWLGLRASWTPTLATEQPAATRSGGRRRDPLLRDRNFVAVLAAMTLAGFAIYAALINLVPLLVESGFSTQQAAVVLAVGGIGQVAGRIAYAPALGPATPDTKVIVVLLVTAATTVGLAVSSPIVALCAISVIAGSARGAFTLIQATAVTDRWGTASYGARSAVLSGGVHLAAATAPWLGALAAVALGGYQQAFLALALCALLAAALTRIRGRSL
jgi:cyanate permease